MNCLLLELKFSMHKQVVNRDYHFFVPRYDFRALRTGIYNVHNYFFLKMCILWYDFAKKLVS